MKTGTQKKRETTFNNETSGWKYCCSQMQQMNKNCLFNRTILLALRKYNKNKDNEKYNTI